MEDQLFLGDCLNLWDGILKENPNSIIVTDPPFNVGYKYKTYKDKMPEKEYYAMLKHILKEKPCVVIHYPEQICRLSIELGKAPNRIVSWVYNSNTARQHRDIAFWDVEPNFSNVKQPYKNPNDKRIKERIANGSKGRNIYDWWEVNRVKNVSKEKTEHPCQMPLKVMENIIGLLPKDITIIDPFMGSGTTGVACKRLGRKFVGIEIDEEYFKVSRQRIEEITLF